MLEKRIFFILVVPFISISTLFADNAEFRLQESRNDMSEGGEFHADLQLRITSGTSSRTLNSLTADVYYTSELDEWGDNWPGTGWFSPSDGYSRSVSKNSGYYRVLVTGDGVGMSGPGDPPGWTVTTSWQNVVTLRWLIGEATSVTLTIADNTDEAAYFENDNNNPWGDAIDWTMSNQDLGEVSLPVELASFSACCTEEGVLLEWATESELENAGFILDRQGEGEADWTTLASYETHDALKGQGNTSERKEYAFTDVNVYAGDVLRYRLTDVSTGGVRTVNDILTITVTEDVIPKETALERAYPNPFNPETKISYKLSKDASVTLRVFDLKGRNVKTIIEGRNQKAGHYHIFWNGRSESGGTAPSGVYILLLQAGDVMKTQKVMLVR